MILASSPKPRGADVIHSVPYPEWILDGDYLVAVSEPRSLHDLLELRR